MTDPGMYPTWKQAAPLICAAVLTWAIVIGGAVYLASMVGGAP